MTYDVSIESRARREYLELPAQIRERVTDVIDDLANDPRPPGAKALTAVAGYRVRRGDYRILYTIDDETHVVRVYRIGHRREVYRRL